MLTYAYWITQALLTVAVFCSVFRVFRGPSVLDRVISVDVILIIVSSMLITDMVARGHQDFILFVVATAVIGFLGAVAIARYVAVRRPEDSGVSVLTGALPQVATSSGDPSGAPDGADAGPRSGGSPAGPGMSGAAPAGDGGAMDGGRAPYAASPSRLGGMDPVDPHGGTLAPRGYGEDEDPATSWFRELTRSGFTTRRRRAAEEAEEEAQHEAEEPSGETPDQEPGEGTR
ncbi:monovalent cation/H+ antiporter complex subunit F [Nesterenkonia xinjiangensis]|nr:monovalent cation/H+ antiporter complex subunit F [Nesterenkonia xinjiangensis]